MKYIPLRFEEAWMYFECKQIHDRYCAIIHFPVHKVSWFSLEH